MKKRTGWLIGGLALTAGAIGAVNTRRKRNRMQATRRVSDVWARPGMLVTFRAELMPGRERDDRTFRVRELLPSGRVSTKRETYRVPNGRSSKSNKPLRASIGCSDKPYQL
jgi:hypothetical protein